jgi:uncharacterized membrane protein (DUF2068 family)
MSQIEQSAAGRVKFVDQPDIRGVVKKADTRNQTTVGLRTVAIYELVKGLLVLIVGLGCLSLVGKDVQVAAEDILKHLHLDPAWHYSRVFIEVSATLTDTRLRLIALAAGGYAIVRIVETYGLWCGKRWAEWFAVISAGLYVPFELVHLWHHPTALSLAVIIGNIVIVIYLARLLMDQYRARKTFRDHPADAPSQAA